MNQDFGNCARRSRMFLFFFLFFWAKQPTTFEGTEISLLRLAHNFIDPRYEFLDIGIYAGQVFATTADAPGNQTD